jgi:hypothetical protein
VVALGLGLPASCKSETLGNSGGPLIDKRVGSQGPERGSRHPTHLIGLYFGLGAKRSPKGLRHHTHNAPRPVVAMG